jgi:hypothetical protein
MLRDDDILNGDLFVVDKANTTPTALWARAVGKIQ